jgi:hypothetical protein
VLLQKYQPFKQLFSSYFTAILHFTFPNMKDFRAAGKGKIKYYPTIAGLSGEFTL